MKFLEDKKGDEGLSKGKPKSKLKSIKQIDINPAMYLKAGYPIIYIRTEENERAVGEIRSLMATDPIYSGKCIFGEWKATTGLITYDNPDPKNAKGQEVVADILKSLNYLEDSSLKKQINPDKGTVDPDLICCFHNIKHFLNNFIFIQKLRDLYATLKVKGNHLFIIGPSLEIPLELTSVISVYDLALPTAEHFKSNFKALVSKYEKPFNIKPTDDDFTAMANAAVGMTAIQGENACSLSLAATRNLSPYVVSLEKEQAIKRSEVIEFVHPDDTMAALGGFDYFKEWIAKRANTYSPEAQKYGLKHSKGVLILGLPGCGKSLCVKCIASLFRLPLLRLDMGRVYKSLVGSSEERIRSALKTAVAVAPVVLWIDEINKGMSGAGSSGRSDGGTTDRVGGTILTFMQENKAPVFFACTANEVETLDPALLRKGRFTEIWGVLEPNGIEREEIWKIHIGKVRPDRVGDFDYEALVVASAGYTGAEIEGIVEESMHDAWHDGKREMVTDDLIKATSSIVPQSITSRDKIDSIRSWMEKKVRFVSKHYKPNYENDDAWRQIKASVE
jgi:ATP-dependent 26S proteasome regulatory subunit